VIHYSIDNVEFNPNSVVTVGTFDGLHIAHYKILDTLVEKSRSTGSRSVVITFKPHPQEILGKGKVEMLATEEERVQMMSDAGIDDICLLQFDRDFSLITAEDFLVKLVHEKIGLRELVLGYNHTFGRGAQGTVEFARKIGEKIGFDVDFVGAVSVGDVTVSSSNIKKLLKEGNVVLANKMLGRPFSFDGFVIRGDGRGRMLGYPTANLKLTDERLLIPSYGVYIVEVVAEGNKFIGLASVGVRPTFESNGVVTIEVWISDFDRDIYGKRIKVSFMHRLREELKFDSADQLIAQMNLDKKMMNEYLVRTVNKKK